MNRLILKRPSWLFRRFSKLNMVDMHVHTDYSDANFALKALIRKCLRKKIGVCVTDHNYVRGSLEICKSNVFSIPSVELTSNDYIDLLVYFYHPSDLKDYYEKFVRGHRVIPTGLNFNLLRWKTHQVLHQLKDYNCLISIAHPDAAEPQNALRFFKEHPLMLKDVHAIEVMNSLQSRKSNQLAYDYALTLNKSMTGGSDAHVLRAVGSTLTMSDGYDTDRFLDNILKRKSIIRGYSLVGTHWMKNVYNIGKDILFWRRKVFD